MPYPSRLTRCNINASLTGGEIMVHTVWLQRDLTVPGATSLQTLADRVRDSWTVAMNGGGAVAQGVRVHLAASTVYQNVTAYSVDAAGRATNQAVSSFTGVTGTSTGSALPPQCALVVSLLTGRPGRSGRGRLYLGGLSAGNLTTTGRLDPQTRGQILASMAQFYVQVRSTNNADDSDRPVVVSPTRTEAYKIKAVGIGDVYDTMRSRRNRLTEARIQAVVDAT